MRLWKGLNNGEIKQEDINQNFQLPRELETFLFAARLSDFGISVTINIQDIFRMNPTWKRRLRLIMDHLQPSDVRLSLL